MKCNVCKKDFILSRDESDYNTKKQKLEDELSKYVEENFEKDEEGCWIKVINAEALLLKPLENPKFCPSEICGAMICGYCYDTIKNYYQKTNICPICMH